jgi:hypothetical protein
MPQQDGLDYLVMELLEGQALLDRRETIVICRRTIDTGSVST